MMFQGKTSAEMVEIAGYATGMRDWLQQRFAHCQNM
jgi:hypothetical protein